jgi:hypothetical protein
MASTPAPVGCYRNQYPIGMPVTTCLGRRGCRNKTNVRGWLVVVAQEMLNAQAAAGIP